MRLRRLHLQRYGHFADATLDFSNGSGLQVIHGHNEAGKSTLLQFVREVLFGFAVQNRYAFTGEKLAGSAWLEFADGQECELLRRKAKIDQLTCVRSGQPETITETTLQGWLGGANSALFRSVFAFGLSELAEGEASLKIESVQHALHGGGLTGAINPQKVVKSLTDEAEALYKERGSKQEIAALTAEIRHLQDDLNKKVTKTEVYLQRKRDFEEARATADDLAQQLAQLRRDQARLKRIATAYPIWRELTDRQARRATQGPASPITAETRLRFDKMLEELKRVTRELAKLEREIQTAEAELQKNPAQTEWLAQRTRIEQARELTKSVQDARRDLPLREAEYTAHQQQIREGITDVIATWTMSDLEQFRCDAGQRSECEQLADLKRSLDNEAIRLTERDSTLRQEQSELQAEQQGLGPLSDVSTLEACLNRYSDHVAKESEFARLRKDHGRRERTLAAQIQRLTPPLPAGQSAAQLARLPVPSVTQIQQFQNRLTDVQRRMTSAENSLIEARERYEQLAREFAAARGHLADVPTQEGLQVLRTQRDAHWERLRQASLAGTHPTTARTATHTAASSTDSTDPDGSTSSTGSAEQSPSLAEAYRQMVLQADDYADRMFQNASLVQKQEQVHSAQREVTQKESDLGRQQQAREQLQQEWNILWSDCGLIPFDPDTMSEWRSHYDTALTTARELTDQQVDLEQLQQEIEAFEVRLQALLPDVSGDVAELVAIARQRVARQQQLAQEHKTVEKQTVRLARAAEQLTADQQSLHQRLQDWDTQWQSWLARQQFPAAWHPELALTVISRLQNLRDRLQQLPALEGRMVAMRQRLAEFDPLVQELCTQVAPELQTQPPELAARHLAERLQTAIDTDTRRTTLTRELARFQSRLDELRDQQRMLQTERQALLDLAGTPTEEAFLQEAERAAVLRELDQQITANERELARLRELDDATAFQQELQTIDATELDRQRTELEQQIRVLEEDERKANELKGATGKELEQLDGSAAAAELQEQINQRRAALANAVDRYVPLLFARQMLQQTLQRYEKESQPALLNDVSRLFAAMTEGRYHRVERPTVPDQPLVVYRSGNTESLRPADLSTGTREQLYLAIRLAYVLHYCTKAEPLPIVLDDVFANFDPARTRQTLKALGEISHQVQVLLFTCHPHVVTLARDVFPTLQPVDVPPSALAHVS